ncbi:MAG: competence/damage-inducible protein A [Deltaproteobacteria bacterium]|nr:MAG: competence/damage-inducible protein A [Deltaproteobacteria bacterium]
MEKPAVPQSVALGIIGDEVLKGEVEDKNTSFFIKRFREIGVDVLCVMILPDRIDMISDFVRTMRERVDFVILTGGIGPTPDDITRDAVAKALGRELILHPGAEKKLREFYGDRLTDSRLNMAMLPDGASLIENPVSGAPGFMVENILVFPGIPSLIEEMFPQVRPLFRGTSFHKGIVYMESGESSYSDIMERLMKEFPSLSIGSYPSLEGGYRVRLVVRGQDGEEVRRCVEKFVTLCRERGLTVKETVYEENG